MKTGYENCGWRWWLQGTEYRQGYNYIREFILKRKDIPIKDVIKQFCGRENWLDIYAVKSLSFKQGMLTALFYAELDGH